MKSLSLVLFVSLVGGAVACSHAQTARPVAVAPTEAPAPVATVATTPTPIPAKTAVSPNVAVSGDLAMRCHLHAADETQAAPKFGYNETQLLPEDRDALQQIANCLTTGPLAGHAVKLTGRADPRGTEEYNLGLGTRRADTVVQYLERLGVANRKLASSTRGAEDATGNDETTWKHDRRVDLELND